MFRHVSLGPLLHGLNESLMALGHDGVNQLFLDTWTCKRQIVVHATSSTCIACLGVNIEVSCLGPLVCRALPYGSLVVCPIPAGVADIGERSQVHLRELISSTAVLS